MSARWVFSWHDGASPTEFLQNLRLPLLEWRSSSIPTAKAKNQIRFMLVLRLNFMIDRLNCFVKFFFLRFNYSVCLWYCLSKWRTNHTCCGKSPAFEGIALKKFEFRKRNLNDRSTWSWIVWLIIFDNWVIPSKFVTLVKVSEKWRREKGLFSNFAALLWISDPI